MRIVTERLILRPLEAADGPNIAEATKESWDDLSQWMRWADDCDQRSDPANCTLYAQLCNDKFLSKQDFIFGGFSKDDGEFILTSRLTCLNKAESLYIFNGYWCRSARQNQGYMTEAVQALIRYAMEHLDARKFYIHHAAGNIKTRAVMNKLGFVEETILPNAHELPSGIKVDEHVLSLTPQLAA